MARKFILSGKKVTVICCRNDRSSSGLIGSFKRKIRRGMVDGIEVIEMDFFYSNHMALPQRLWVFFKFSLYCSFIVLREDYDILVASSPPLTNSIPALAARWLRGKRMVFEVRDPWSDNILEMNIIKNRLLLPALRLLEWLSYRSAEKVIALSPGVENIMIRSGVDRKKIALIPNGCDFRLVDCNQTCWRPNNIPSDAFLAVFAGAHGMANGLDAVLDAACVLQDSNNKNIWILLVGDGLMKPNLMKRAQRERLNNVIFIDPIDKVKLISLLRASNVGLQILLDTPVFHFGSSPNKFFDYLSCGLPVLNNYPGWIAELIKKNNCGCVVSSRDPVAFADALINMAANPEKLKQMGENARQLAQSAFSRDKLAERFIAHCCG